MEPTDKPERACFRPLLPYKITWRRTSVCAFRGNLALEAGKCHDGQFSYRPGMPVALTADPIKSISHKID